MKTPARVAWVLWLVFGVAVFSVTFDWGTRQAGFRFVNEQSARRAQGQPLATIDEGFRPLVRDAAAHSALWLLVIIAAGTGGVAVASKTR